MQAKKTKLALVYIALFALTYLVQSYLAEATQFERIFSLAMIAAAGLGLAAIIAIEILKEDLTKAEPPPPDRLGHA